MKVNTYNHDNFTEADKKKLAGAVHVLQSVLGSSLFKGTVRTYSHNGGEGFYFRPVGHPSGGSDTVYTNEEVLQIILAAVEKKGNRVNGECDLHVCLINKSGGSSVGYTKPSIEEIYTYRNWFRSFRSVGYASHLAHEWCHKLGFTHDPNETAERPFSVPYAIGDMVGKLYDELHIMDSDGFPDLP